MDWDCPAVCQNMLLAAHSLGLGSIWTMSGVPVLAHPQAKEAIELSEGEKVFGMILLGYPRIWPDPPPKKPPSVKWL
jgi:nitroreductase